MHRFEKLFLILFVPLINQIYYDLHHHVFLLRLAFSDHQRQGYESVISQALRAVSTIEDTIIV